MHPVVECALREQRHEVFVIRLGEALPEVEVEGCAGVALHNIVEDGAEELLGSEIVLGSCLGEDSEGAGGGVLGAGIWSCGTKEREGEVRVDG